MGSFRPDPVVHANQFERLILLEATIPLTRYRNRMTRKNPCHYLYSCSASFAE